MNHRPEPAPGEQENTILTARQRAVLEALRGSSMTAHEVARVCNMTREAAMGALIVLYARGLVGRRAEVPEAQTPAVWSIEDAGVRALEVGDG